MDIKINAKKKIEGEKPIFDFQGPTQVTLKMEEDIDPSTSLYLAGSKVFKDSDKLLFLSTHYSINENEITFIVDTYTENWLQYINEMKTPFNIEFGKMENEKTIYLLDKVFGNPRVYLEGVPPANLPDYYTKEEADAKFTTKEEYDELSGIVSGDIHNLAQNYWTKQEVAAAIADIQTMELQVVQELPPLSSAQEYTIYLVPSQDQEIGNIYQEYLVINQQFELIGSTEIDLSNYARKDVDEAFLSGISIGTKIVQGATIGSERWNATNNTGCLLNNASSAGNYSLAHGFATSAKALYSHAEGNSTSTTGGAYGAHAEGRETVARFPYSHVEGYGTGSGEDYQHVEGVYNVQISGAVRVTGGGTNSTNRKNIEVLDWDGNLTIAGDLTFVPSGTLSSVTLGEKLLNAIPKTYEISTSGDAVKFTTSSDKITFYANDLGGIILGQGNAINDISTSRPALALGISCKAGHNSVAVGYAAFATGTGCFAFGSYLQASLSGKTVYGRYNVNPTADTKISFGCGGTDGSSREDLFTVSTSNEFKIYQNTVFTSSVTLSGDMTFKPRGASSGITLTDKFNQYIPLVYDLPDDGMIQISGYNDRNLFSLSGTIAAMGYDTLAGRYGVAIGPYSKYNVSSGNCNGTAMGFGCLANKTGKTVYGRYNDNPTDDTLISMGCGASASSRDDAWIIKTDKTFVVKQKSVFEKNIDTIGKENITLSELSGIIPSEGKVMKYTLSAADEVSFDVTSLTANNTVDFELQLIQPSTAVTVTFPQGIIWGENGHFSSSNLAPDLTTGNTLYDFSIRWNGTRFLINLAYTEEIGQ